MGTSKGSEAPDTPSGTFPALYSVRNYFPSTRKKVPPWQRNLFPYTVNGNYFPYKPAISSYHQKDGNIFHFFQDKEALFSASTGNRCLSPQEILSLCQTALIRSHETPNILYLKPLSRTQTARYGVRHQIQPIETNIPHSLTF